MHPTCKRLSRIFDALADGFAVAVDIRQFESTTVPMSIFESQDDLVLPRDFHGLRHDFPIIPTTSLSGNMAEHVAELLRRQALTPCPLSQRTGELGYRCAVFAVGRGR